jgi:hypothetical protein
MSRLGWSAYQRVDDKEGDHQFSKCHHDHRGGPGGAGIASDGDRNPRSSDDKTYPDSRNERCWPTTVAVVAKSVPDGPILGVCELGHHCTGASTPSAASPSS